MSLAAGVRLGPYEVVTPLLDGSRFRSTFALSPDGRRMLTVRREKVGPLKIHSLTLVRISARWTSTHTCRYRSAPVALRNVVLPRGMPARRASGAAVVT